MKLSNEMLGRYVGGQLEICNSGEKYCFRGQIKMAQVVPDDSLSQVAGHGQCATLRVEFDYLCKWAANHGYRPDENKPYELSLLIASANYVGLGRLAVLSSVVGELAVFYPPTHDKRVLADGTMEVVGDCHGGGRL